MKKLALFFIVCVVVMLSVSLAYAADNTIVESPDVKIVIDCTAGTYTDVPLVVNGRTLLPLRAVLNNLGVEDANIVWNGTERSVTATKGSVKISLKVDSTTAYVNDAPVTLDVAPMVYSKNSRTYIPARFVAQSFGKKVVWDGSTKTVLIREEAAFNQVRDLLQASNTAMSGIEKAKFDMDMKMSISQTGMSLNLNANGQGEVDKQSKMMYLDMKMAFLGQSMDVETYLANNATYTKNPTTGGWTKQAMDAAEFEKAFEESDNTNLLSTSDALYAGLAIEDDPASDKILLKGSAYLSELLDQISKSAGTANMQISKLYLEITLDRDTKIMDNVHMDMDGAVEAQGQKVGYSAQIGVTYTDLNGDFTITLPSDLE